MPDGLIDPEIFKAERVRKLTKNVNVNFMMASDVFANLVFADPRVLDKESSDPSCVRGFNNTGLYEMLDTQTRLLVEL